MRYSHAFRYPRYPFVNESVDQAEQLVVKTQVPGKNVGGWPWKPSHEKIKKTSNKRKKLTENGESAAKDDNEGAEEKVVD